MRNIRLIEYNKSFNSSLESFNKRIRDSGNVFPNPEEWQYYEGDLINQKFYVLIDQDKIISAICAIKNQIYLLKGNEINFQFIEYPISLSVVDSKYATDSIFLLKKITSASENMHGIGMGGLEEPLPKILRTLKFKTMLIPFFSYPISIQRFIELILRRKTGYDFKYLISIFCLFDFILKCFHSFKDKFFSKNFHFEEFNEFADTDNALWDSISNDFDLIAIKNKQNLNALYNKTPHHLHKFKIFENGKYLGWAILKITKHSKNKYFNNCTTATIVDLLCNQTDYDLFLTIIKRISRINKADMVLVNSTFGKFNDRLKKSHFIPIPSNYGFAYKTNIEFSTSNAWLTRADGDGPINL